MRYARGRHAWGICAKSGIRMLLRKMVVDGQTGMLVHPGWYDPKHPLETPPRVDDAIALYRPAPDPDPSVEIPLSQPVWGDTPSDFHPPLPEAEDLILVDDNGNFIVDDLGTGIRYDIAEVIVVPPPLPVEDDDTAEAVLVDDLGNAVIEDDDFMLDTGFLPVEVTTEGAGGTAFDDDFTLVSDDGFEVVDDSGDMVGASGAIVTGQGLAIGIGAAIVASVGSAAGAGTAPAIGVSSVGATAGTGAVAGTGISTAAAAGLAAGTGAVAGTGISTAAAIGSAAGEGASPATSDPPPTSATGSAAGAGAVAGVGRSTSAGVGSAAGTGAVAGVGRSTRAGVGSAAGTGAVAATGSALTSPQLAFPEARGFGRFATGGRGGSIIHVTNLNDSGFGSLRTALTTSGARHIVFDVGGTINLASEISITNKPNFSVWGETAPSPGIQIRNFGLVIRSSNFIIRHLVIRPEAGPDVRDGIRIVRFTGDAYAVGNGIIDHCTAQWAGDENISIFPSIDTPITDVTIQNTLMCESMEDGCLIADNVDRISVINNLMAKNEARHPRVHTFANLEIINNISYFCGNDDIQVGGTSATGGATPCNLSVINNRFIDGPVAFASNGCIDWEAGIWDDGTSKLYHTGNVHIGSVNRPIFLNKHLTANPIVGTPPISSGMGDIQTADAAFETWLLNRVGSRPNQRDSQVIDVINDVINRTGALAPHDTLTGYGAPVTYASTSSTYVPPANPNSDDDGDGYTNIEEDMFTRSAALLP